MEKLVAVVFSNEKAAYDGRSCALGNDRCGSGFLF